MTIPLVTVVIPTVPGREEHYARCLAAYERYDQGIELEVITEFDHPAVGWAWQAGGERATGDYIHFTNDDCVPHPGWAFPAIEACQAGYIPGPQVYGEDGSPQAPPVWGEVSPDWTRLHSRHAVTIPFLSRRQWQAVQPLFTGHYYADNWISHRARLAGWPSVLRIGYAFTHYWAQVRRGAGFATQAEREAYDARLYALAVESLSRGEWTEPWP